MDVSAFKAYDIRGLYPEQVNEELAYRVGRALVVFLKAKDIAVGIDMRTSSESLFKELARGINDQGANVRFIGMCPTPLLNFTVAKHSFCGGVMISASHNPGKYNAFKLIQKPALQIGGDAGLEDIKKLVLENKFPSSETKGKIKHEEILQDYLDHIRSFATFSNLNIVIDYGNGVGALTGKPFFKDTPDKIISLYEEPDGNFPNHPANPHELENFNDLQEAVKKNKADLGVFFDGDADRALFVDEKGEIIPADLGFCLQAIDVLKIKQDEKVYFDLRFSKIVPEKIKEAKGIPVMEKVGNPIYKELLINKGGILGGEFSGHVMYQDNYAIDDGLFSTVRFLNIVSEAKSEGKTISQLIEPLEKYFATPEINLKVKDNAEKDSKVSEVLDYYQNLGYEILKLDGVTVTSDDFWFNVRKSNTEPIVRVRIEANTSEILEKVKTELIGILQK